LTVTPDDKASGENIVKVTGKLAGITGDTVPTDAQVLDILPIGASTDIEVAPFDVRGRLSRVRELTFFYQTTKN
jgi:hypothetical protein